MYLRMLVDIMYSECVKMTHSEYIISGNARAYAGTLTGLVGVYGEFEILHCHLGAFQVQYIR